MSERSDEPIVIHPPEPGMAAPMTASSVLLDASLARTGPEVIVPEAVAPLSTGAPADTSRSLALDVFRGIWMVLMVFSFAILGKAGLPAWMYHMQFPPPAEQFAALAGLTWRDLVFPGFLFTMAAAIPLATSHLLSAQLPYPGILWRGAKRAALLFVFALLIGHTNPYWTQDYTRLGNVMALLGFLACWPLLLSRRSDWNPARFRIFKLLGYAGIIALFAALPLIYGESFSLFRKDNIIHALAFVGLATLPIWLFTRHNLKARLTIVAIITALKLGASAPGWTHELWQTRAWFLEPWFVELLIITIPGTIAGDLLLNWLQRSAASAPPQWHRVRLQILALVSALFTPVLLVGLYTRQVGATTLTVFILTAIGLALVQRPITGREQVLARLWRWGAVFLVLGMLVEPYEGGIKKDPQTLSFLLLMTGYCFVSLAALLIVADLFPAGRSVLRPIAQAGKNPLLMYVLFSLGINHIAYLIGVGDYFTTGVFPALMRATFFTVLTTALVVLATRRRVFWKA